MKILLNLGGKYMGFIIIFFLKNTKVMLHVVVVTGFTVGIGFCLYQ